jgi:5-formyltetrahydrofolate cyclo-ligase
MKDWNEVKPWRKARRAELFATRIAIAPQRRKAWNDRITALPETGFPVPAGAIVGFCWPYKGEFDARFAVRHWCERGAIAALPEVVEKARPMQFRKWWPGAPMTKGVYGMPVPAGTEALLPDTASIPMNGFDEQGYRFAAAATPESRCYASPPCYAGGLDPEYFGTMHRMSTDGLVELLNTLLEAERAGARLIAAFLGDYERDTPAWRQLAAVQRDEAKNCAILIDLIRRLNGTPSSATGDFLGKALAVQGRAARLQFLNRGQKWVARRIGEALPGVEQDFVRIALLAMRESHVLNIDVCDALVEVLEAPTSSR